MGEMTDDDLAGIREEILRLTRIYSGATHFQNRPAYDARPPLFEPGVTTVPYAGRVFDTDEVAAGVESMLDFWLTLGPRGAEFERDLASYLGVRKSLLTNSGSSANLLALSALTSPKIQGFKRLRPGDEVITVAAGFPTTVAPIVQCGATVVFIDADPVTGNARCDQLWEVYKPGKTKAVILAHALGNPFDIARAKEFCDTNGIWLIEDNCDALGSRYNSQLTGSFGDLSTQSFYPPHHLTLGEGGAVNIINNARLKVLVESFRDWGRDCWCPSGVDNTCNKRFCWQLGDLPEGYDHKYTYSHLGYNLKPLDLQAAIGSQQLKKLPNFVAARQQNWQTLRAGLDECSDVLEFSLPTHATAWNSDGSFTWDESGNTVECSWFGFKMSVKPNAKFTRTDLVKHLDACKIGNRMLFGGNLMRQPAFVQLKKDAPESIRVVSDLKGSDEIMNNTVFIGVYPGLTEQMLDYVINSIKAFVHQ